MVDAEQLERLWRAEVLRLLVDRGKINDEPASSAIDHLEIAALCLIGQQKADHSGTTTPRPIRWPLTTRRERPEAPKAAPGKPLSTSVWHLLLLLVP